MQRLVRVLLALGLAACATPTSTRRQGHSFDLLIAATTDVHGRLRGWDYYASAPDSVRGLARAATIVDSLRAAAPGRVVLVDAGDLLQGSPLTYVAARVAPSRTHPVIAAMNAMRYDAAVIGNHDFNYGLPALDRAIAQASFPFLAANAYAPDGRRVYPAWRMIERSGAKIAFVGATTPGSNVWDRENLRGRVVIRDIIPDVRAAVDSARGAGADVVIALLHSGLDEPSSYDTAATGLPSENVAARVAAEVPGIDLIVYGHSHKQMTDTTIGSALLMQPKNWATTVGVAHFRLERVGSRWRVVATRSELVPTARHAESRAVLDATREAHERTVAYVATPIGSTPVAWRADSARVQDTPLIDFLLEVERRTAGADLASTPAFALDASLDSGAITMAEMARLYPYENTLKAVRITGRQLREYLEYSARYFGTLGTREPAVDPEIPGYNFDIVAGAEYTIDASKPIGSRVTRLAVWGKLVGDADSFILALNNYRQTGGGGYTVLRGAPVVYDGQTEIRQLLIDEVKRRGVITPADYFTPNWSLEPRAAVERAYAAMRRLAGEGGPVSTANSRARAAAGDGRAGGRALRLRIIATNDFHGALESRIDSVGVRRGGAAAVSAAIARAAESCPRPCETLLVDGGDLLAGSAVSSLAHGKPVIELYNELGYAASALGNHEFDWGADTLRARIRDARFAILGANVRYADGRDVPWIPDDTLVRRGPIQVGITGILGPETYRSIMARNVADLRFDDPAPIVDSLARALRARGADVVVVLAHSGAFCSRDGTQPCRGEVIDLATRLAERVDAIVAGHTHTLMDATVRGIPIVQARSNGRAVAVVDLAVGGRSKGTSAASGHVTEALADSSPPSPRVDALLRRATARVASRVNRPIARIATAMPREGDQYPLGNLIADAQRRAGRGDFAIVNNGGIRTGLQAGVATYGSLFDVQPFGNALYRITMRGAALRDYMERLLARGTPGVHVSGLVVTYDSTLAPGRRILSLRRSDGRPIRDDARYTIVMNEFMATGGDGLGPARGVLKSEVLPVRDLEALVSYLQSLPQPVVPPRGDRLISTHQRAR